MNVFLPADILLPKDVDMRKWSVIACDQFTSDPEYWQRVRKTAGDDPSTIHLILPEAELSGDRKAAVEAINANMVRYMADGIFAVKPGSYVYVERTLVNGAVRPGLIGMVDLEQYDYNPGSVSLIRATEKTVVERIPPRKEIRRDATLEFPHILMLCDDDEKSLIESVAQQKDRLEKIYDFDLMEEGGHITGWLVNGAAAEEFNRRFGEYSQSFEKKYQGLSGAKVLLAVGDGNHSLATAKSCYEELKANHPDMDLSMHPARFALVELENIHDPSQVFEPIHRVLFKIDTADLLQYLSRYCSEDGFAVDYIAGTTRGTLYLDRSRGELAVAVLQTLLDEYLANNAGEIDYIHGEEEVASLAAQEDAIGFLLPPMEKGQLFRGVIDRGTLPRKTFSMGHAREKRYYLEGRKIK